MFVVGPESAGAHPGPACYRKGNRQFVRSFYCYSLYFCITRCIIVISSVHSLVDNKIYSSRSLTLPSLVSPILKIILMWFILQVRQKYTHKHTHTAGISVFLCPVPFLLPSSGLIEAWKTKNSDFIVDVGSRLAPFHIMWCPMLSKASLNYIKYVKIQDWNTEWSIYVCLEQHEYRKT